MFLAGWSLRLLVGRPGRLQGDLVSGAAAARPGGGALRRPDHDHHDRDRHAGGERDRCSTTRCCWNGTTPRAVFYDPVLTHIGLAALTHHLGYFDILPLYVVLMAVAPVFAIIDRYAPNWLLPLSLALYFVTLVVPIPMPTWPMDGQWFFNPLAWQLIFVLGFVHGAGGRRRRLCAPPHRADPLDRAADRRWSAPMSSGISCGPTRPGCRSRCCLFIADKTYVTPDARDPVSGADRGVFGDLSLYQALGVGGWSSSARCWGAIRFTCSASARS